MEGVDELPKYLQESTYAPSEQENGWAEPFIGKLVASYYSIKSNLWLINQYPKANAPKEVFEKTVSYDEFK